MENGCDKAKRAKTSYFDCGPSIINCRLCRTSSNKGLLNNIEDSNNNDNITKALKSL